MMLRGKKKLIKRPDHQLKVFMANVYMEIKKQINILTNYISYRNLRNKIKGKHEKKITT